MDGGPGGYQAPTGKTSAITLTARCVVLATGPETVPHVPKVPGKESFKGTVVHSTQYKNGAPYKGRKVLVVRCRARQRIVHILCCSARHALG